MTAPRSYPPQRRPGTQPVYRTRNHAYTCRCQACSNRAAYSADLAKGCLFPALIAAGIAGLVCVARLPLVIWHKTGPHGQLEADTATVIAYLVAAAVVVAPMVFFSVRSARKRPSVMTSAGGPKRVKAPASAPPMSSLPPTAADTIRAAPPLCMHLGAVKVDSSVQEGLIWCCWCPDCDTELPANWRRLCCGSEPETPHVYNCPQRLKEVTP